jgi:hypothetical protein
MIAHTHQIGSVDALEAFGHHGFDTEKARVPFAAQSRDDPVPYSLPAMIDQGRCPAFSYFIEAS